MPEKIGAVPAKRTGIQMSQYSTPQENYQALASGRINEEALREGTSVSALLEQNDPTERYADHERTLDAFGRILKLRGIRTTSSPAQGVRAHTMDVLFKKENRAILQEWAYRRWREARFNEPANPFGTPHGYSMGDGPRQRQVLISSDDGGVGGIWRPYVDLAGERSSLISPPIMLSSLVARTTPVTGSAVRMAYMTEPSAEQLRMYRVGETAEIPLSGYEVTQHDVRLYKYGRGIQLSYERMREDPIDRVAFWLQRQAIQNENDKVATALDVIINGDGNANGATSTNKTAVQSGSGSDPLTLKGWLSFLALFYPDYTPTRAGARLADYIDILTLTAATDLPPMANTGWVGGVSQVRPLADQVIQLARVEALPASTVLVFDPRFALEHLTQIGSNITESDKFITNQTQVLVMTETEGFDIIDKNASRTLIMNA